MSIYENGLYGALFCEHYVSRIRQLNKERSARIAALKTRADAEAYVAEVRQKIAASFDLPPRPADLAASITGTIETPDCRIEKIIFESRPDFPVTAHLFIPNGLTAPAPAVLFLCGHSQEGKLCDVYQTGARTLAARGFVTLLVDPIAQGERYQFLNVPRSYYVGGCCTREHNMLGKQLWLCDEFFGSWRAHDALCGLDYLLSRPEVDRSRVGVTGNSGGGTMTTFVQALDPRFTMAAPSCYVTSWQRNIENELPADVEQMPPGLWSAGCEMGDLVLAYAPRPILLLGQKNDFFDPRGLRETFEECRKVYALLGAEENLQCFTGPTSHGYSVENRKQMYAFFAGHAGMPEYSDDEVDVTTPAVSQLLCTPTGQAADLPGKKLVHDLIVEKADALAAARKKLDLPGLKELLTGKYALPASVPVPYCRTLRNDVCNVGTPALGCLSRFALENSSGLLTPAILLTPDRHEVYFHFPEMTSLTLFVPHLSTLEELSAIGFDGPVLGVDVRGIGMARSYNCDVDKQNDFFNPYGVDYHFNSCEIMSNSSLLNGKIADLLSAVAYARSRGVKEFHIRACGQGCIPALLAAVLCDEIKSVKLSDAPVSFADMAKSRITMWPQSAMLRGILKYTDLPEIYELLKAEKSLEIINFANNVFEK